MPTRMASRADAVPLAAAESSAAANAIRGADHWDRIGGSLPGNGTGLLPPTPPAASSPHCLPEQGGFICARDRQEPAPMTALDPIPYADAKIRRILSTVRTIAMVGAST